MDKANTCPSHQEIKGKVQCLGMPLLNKQKCLNLGSTALCPGINDSISPQATQLVTKPAQSPDLDYGYTRREWGRQWEPLRSGKTFERNKDYAVLKEDFKKITQKWLMKNKEQRLWGMHLKQPGQRACAGSVARLHKHTDFSLLTGGFHLS